MRWKLDDTRGRRRRVAWRGVATPDGDRTQDSDDGSRATTRTAAVLRKRAACAFLFYTRLARALMYVMSHRRMHLSSFSVTQRQSRFHNNKPWLFTPNRRFGMQRRVLRYVIDNNVRDVTKGFPYDFRFSAECILLLFDE